MAERRSVSAIRCLARATDERLHERGSAGPPEAFHAADGEELVKDAVAFVMVRIYKAFRKVVVERGVVINVQNVHKVNHAPANLKELVDVLKVEPDNN